jgi:hypothetical protein
MENNLEIAWVYNTSWDGIGLGKINVNYIIK